VAKSPKKPAAAFFDVDNTLVRGSTSYQFGKEAYRRKFFPRKDFIAFAWGQIMFLTKGETEHMLSAIKDRALELVKGRKYDEMIELVSVVYKQEIKQRLWPETAKLAKEHNNANVVAIGGRMHSTADCKAIIDAFIATPFSNEERHIRRIGLISKYEETGNI
jgi:FMN phosphatase YigB (HAD superfamily)